ncbi:hypothetical protein B0H14DRAFT_3139460 [Mycena olivaceomarginata]|nr:hypothetical protein B0H14DRAFT_3139460 [Mycena olivaceomarginata]
MGTATPPPPFSPRNVIQIPAIALPPPLNGEGLAEYDPEISSGSTLSTMSSITLRRSVVDRDTNKTMYDRVLEDVEALGDTILSKHEIDKTFFRAKPDFKGNIYYEKSGGKSFRAHFIAEPFTDDGVKSLRMILALRCPTGAPEELKKLFRNGIAVLDSIRAADEASEAEHSQHFEITESIFCENGKGDLADNIIMLLRLRQTFEVGYLSYRVTAFTLILDSPANNPPATPNSQRRRITKTIGKFYVGNPDDGNELRTLVSSWVHRAIDGMSVSGQLLQHVLACWNWRHINTLRYYAK